MPRFVSASLVVLVLLLGSSPAAHTESTPQWVEVQSEHFTVISDSNDKQARHIAGQFERMRALFASLFPARVGDSGTRITVFALKDRKGFQALQPAAYMAKGSIELAGLFLRTPDKNYILVRLDSGGEHPYSVVYHEYTHFLLRKSEWIPLWLNEGLAEFYQNTEIEGKDVRLGEPSTDDILYLRDHPLLPLPTLLAVDHNSPYYHEENKGSVFYAESWALTHLIQTTDFTNKTNRLQTYAKFLQQHEDPVTAAQHAFGDLGQLQKALNEYIGQRSFKAFSIKQSFTADEAAFNSTAISAGDVDALRADILIGDQRGDEAKALLAKVLASDPKNTLAHESEGNLCMSQHDINCARKWFSEAVQLGSESAMANYYFAIFSMQGGDKDNDAAVEASLNSTMKSEPNFAPAYDALAHFYAMHNEKLDDAHMLLVHAIDLEPEQLNYRLNASSLEVQRKQYANAMRILQAAMEMTNKPEQIAMIQSRMKQVKAYEDGPPRMVAGSATVTTAGTTATTTDGKTFTVSAAPVETIAKTYPAASASAKHHTVSGTLHEVKCTYPSTLTLKLDDSGKSVSLFTADYYKVPFGAANFKPPDDLNPCEAIEGMKARIEYAEVTDPNVAGQIVSIILSK